MSDVLHVERDGGVATVVIDRPPANAVDPAMIDEFLALLPTLGADPDVRCVVLRGTGRFFVAGADIAVMRDLSEANQRSMRRWVDVQDTLESLPKPVLAAINGHALGGGAELALAADLRIACTSATVGFPEMQLGLFPGAGGSQRLPRLLGPHRAVRLMIDAERLPAERAGDLGLVDVVVSDAEFDATVREYAQVWAAKPTAAIGLLKRAVLTGRDRPLADALAAEAELVLATTRTADAAEGLQAFLDKRTAHFTGR